MTLTLSDQAVQKLYRRLLEQEDLDPELSPVFEQLQKYLFENLTIAEISSLNT